MYLNCIPPERLQQCKGQLLLSFGNLAAFLKVCPTIWNQVLMGRQQLDSSISLTFSQEWLALIGSCHEITHERRPRNEVHTNRCYQVLPLGPSPLFIKNLPV